MRSSPIYSTFYQQNHMIETKRLRIIPLDSEQFALLLNGVHFMENALRLTPSNETLDPHTRQAMTGQYQLAGKHPENFLLLTNWQIILKSENKAIGSACFKNLPDAKAASKSVTGYMLPTGTTVI